jgi:hypothetical protein
MPDRAAEWVDVLRHFRRGAQITVRHLVYLLKSVYELSPQLSKLRHRVWDFSILEKPHLAFQEQDEQRFSSFSQRPLRARRRNLASFVKDSAYEDV